MRSLLSTTMPKGGLCALVRWLPLVVVGSLLPACDDDYDDNQLPFATVEALPTTEIMTEKSRQEYYVDDYFLDPDQDPLSFTASIDDATVATAEFEGSEDSLRLVIEGAGLTGGETMVTLTATDPHGGQAQIFGRVLLVEPVLFWRDDFDGTVDWNFSYVTEYSYLHKPGYLSGSVIHPSFFFAAWRHDQHEENAKDWLVSMSMAVEEGWRNQFQTVGFWSYASLDTTSSGCDVIDYMWASLGEADSLAFIGSTPESNWQIVYFNCGAYPYKVAEYGNSDAVGSVGEFSEMHWGVRLGKMELFVDETLVFSQEAAEGPVEDGWPVVHRKSRLFGYNGIGYSDIWIYFDWAELSGVPIEERQASLDGDWQAPEGSESLRVMTPAPVISHRTAIVAH